VIIESAILIARSFDYEVVAEGVETLEQASALYRLGIDFFQGYYFAKPSHEVNFNSFETSWLE
jgi:diguanylate cyclase